MLARPRLATTISRSILRDADTMNGYDVAFLAGLAFVAWSTRGDRRARAWLACGAASYVVSAAYFRMDGPSPLVMAAVCDAAVATVIYHLARYKWELGLGAIFQAMLGLNIVAIACGVFGQNMLHGLYGVWPAAWSVVSSIPTSRWHDAYAGMLDLANASALAWTWFNGTKQPVGIANGRAASGYPRFGFRRLMLALHRERTRPPFWKVSH